jgi:hypothetical protein
MLGSKERREVLPNSPRASPPLWRTLSRAARYGGPRLLDK